jgi:type IV pilus assembly protein PilA
MNTFERPMAITALAVLDLIGAGMYLLAAVGTGVLALGPHAEPLPILLLSAVFVVLGLVLGAAGVGLLRLQPFGRSLQIGLSVLGLLAIPVGTIISAVVLYYLFRPGIAHIFSGRAPHELSAAEMAEVQAVSGSSGLVLVVIAVVGLFLAVACLGIVAAIAIPSLLRARVSANESAAIGDTRTMISAQMAYQSANGGFYDTIDCLIKPTGCIPSYPATGPSFLDPGMKAAQRRGYRFTLHLGPRAEIDPAVSSPSSVQSFAYVAEPLTQGQTGVRSFCGDSSGIVCSANSRMSEPVDGSCPSECVPLR